MSFEGGPGGPGESKITYEKFMSYYEKFNNNSDSLGELVNCLSEPKELMKILGEAYRFWVNKLKYLNNNEKKVLKNQKNKRLTIHDIAKRETGNFFYQNLLQKNENVKYFGPIMTGSIFAYYLNFLKTLKKTSKNVVENTRGDIKSVTEDPYNVHARWISENARIEGGEVYPPYATDEEIERKDELYRKDLPTSHSYVEEKSKQIDKDRFVDETGQLSLDFGPSEEDD